MVGKCWHPLTPHPSLYGPESEGFNQAEVESRNFSQDLQSIREGRHRPFCLQSFLSSSKSGAIETSPMQQTDECISNFMKALKRLYSLPILSIFTNRLCIAGGWERWGSFGISYIGMTNPIVVSTITVIPNAESLLLSKMLDLSLDTNKERHSLIET